MDKKPLKVKSYNVEDDLRFKALEDRIAVHERAISHLDDADRNLRDAQASTVGELVRLKQRVERIDVLYDARCTAISTQAQRELDAPGKRLAALESQTVDLRRRVAELASRVPVPSEVRYAPVDDHRDKERPVKPAPMMVCERAETCVQPHCQSRVPHPLRDNCKLSCCVSDDDGGRCVPAPAEPEVAIPDVPTPVGTEAFRREMTGHMQTLAQAYSWDADSLPMWGRDYLERLAERACTLRDAYELARTGEHEAAQEKLEEIRW